MAAKQTKRQNGDTALATPQASAGPLATLLGYTQDPDTKRRVAEMLGKRAGAFLNSIINVVKNSKALVDVGRENPASIMSAAMVAASVNLPIDPALGFAAIVPYKNRDGATAQFQLMYKGLIQLAIRSGQYARIHDTEVYKDEIEFYNPITGEVEFTDPATWKMRNAGNVKDIAGFYTYFRLTTGFEASKYITFDQAMAHGKRFSKSYQNDLRYNKEGSLWSTDPCAMGRKTCIKMLLGKYGILSIEMQDAFIAEADDFAEDSFVVSTVVEPPSIGGNEGLKRQLAARNGTGNATTEQSESAVGVDSEPDGDDSRATEADAEPAEPTPPDSDPTEPGLLTCMNCGWTGDVSGKEGQCPDCNAVSDAVAVTSELDGLA